MTPSGVPRVKTGLTFDLRDDYLARGFSAEDVAELDRADTIDVLEQTIRGLGFDTDRIGSAVDLLKRTAAGERWDLVFNIAEGVRGSCRESQVPTILEMFDIPHTFSDARVLALCLDKGVCKRVVRDAGLATAPFAEVGNEDGIAAVSLPFPLFVKPVAEGSSKGISYASRVNNAAELRSACLGILRKYDQPALVETYLTGREFTVGILGTGPRARVVGVMEILFVKDEARNSYSFETKKNYEDLVKYSIATGATGDACADLALKCWHLLGCRDGGRVDIRMDDRNAPMFLEVNPLPGLNYSYSDLPILCGLQGIPYAELINTIIKSAVERYPNLAVRFPIR